MTKDYQAKLYFKFVLFLLLSRKINKREIKRILVNGLFYRYLCIKKTSSKTKIKCN